MMELLQLRVHFIQGKTMCGYCIITSHHMLYRVILKLGYSPPYTACSKHLREIIQNFFRFLANSESFQMFLNLYLQGFETRDGFVVNYEFPMRPHKCSPCNVCSEYACV